MTMQLSNYNNVKEAAKEKTRDILAHSVSFWHMPFNDQKKIYENVLNEQMSMMLGNEHKLSTEMKGGFVNKSSDLLDDKRHERGFEEGVDSFEDLVDSEYFP